MKQIAIHVFIHVPFEGLGCIHDWIQTKGHKLSYTKFYEPHSLPKIDEIDWLIVMGGNMSVYEEALYPWLSVEKQFIQQMITSNKVILGICLGSQLIAEVLGAQVFPNTQKEIGWFNIYLNTNQVSHPLQFIFESKFNVFHWHGDTFNLPQNAIHLFNSDVTINQAFIYNNKVIGLQFHLEVTLDSLNEMIKYGKKDFIESDNVQSEIEIINQSHHILNNNNKMFNLLDYLSTVY